MARIEKYESFDALALAGLVRKGEASAEDLLETAISVAEERNPALNAIVIPMYEQARNAIREGLPDGPFKGVPFLVKDLLSALAGEPMQSGSRMY